MAEATAVAANPVKTILELESGWEKLKKLSDALQKQAEVMDQLLEGKTGGRVEAIKKYTNGVLNSHAVTVDRVGQADKAKGLARRIDLWRIQVEEAGITVG